MAITDVDEWLRPGADHDEVTLEVDDLVLGLLLRVRLVVDPVGRHVHLRVELDGAAGRHEADEAGPPLSNWDRMRIGAVEWRMVEPLRRWELTADDPKAGLHAYLAFSGAGPCAPVSGGYEQVGTATGQLQLADRRVAVAGAGAHRTHTWRVAP